MLQLYVVSFGRASLASLNHDFFPYLFVFFFCPRAYVWLWGASFVTIELLQIDKKCLYSFVVVFTAEWTNSLEMRSRLQASSC